jgi:hypothetical protein
LPCPPPALSGENEQELAHDGQSAHEVLCAPILSTSSPWTAPLLVEHNHEELVDGTLPLGVIAPGPVSAALTPTVSAGSRQTAGEESTAAWSKMLTTDGFVEVVLATDGRAHFFAIDT